MHPRRAYTLVEMVLVIALMALVFSAAAVFLHSVLRSTRAAQSHRGAISSIQRLATQFRDDIHAADSATPADGKLSIHQPQGETIVYAATDAAIERTVEVDGKVTHRDAFDLFPSATAKFETGQSSGGLVSLIIDYPLDAAQPEFSDHRKLRIEAAINIARSHGPSGNVLPERSASPTPE